MPIEILLVENDPRDAQMTQIALKDSKISVNLNLLEDGVEAMAFLYKQEKYTSMSRPDIIFLDLNLPQKDGRQILAEIREDKAQETDSCGNYDNF
jgi:DNA-binding response OmpR family regulator